MLGRLADEGGFATGSFVLIESSSGDNEIIFVTPTGGTTFTTSISSVVGTTNINDGTLQASSGDTLTISYFDIDDGFGGSLTAVDTVDLYVDDHGNQAESATDYYLEVQGFSSFDTGSYRLTGTGSGPAILLGDVNQDGTGNFLDISPFIALLQSRDYLAKGDIDSSGNINFLDISPFIGLLG